MGIDRLCSLYMCVWGAFWEEVWEVSYVLGIEPEIREVYISQGWTVLVRCYYEGHRH